MFHSPLSLDRTNRLITGCVGFVIVGGAVSAALSRAFVALGVVALVALIMVLSWAMGPRAALVTEDELRIERRAWRALRVPLAEVSGVEVAAGTGRAVRLLGVGGFFGSYGIFSNTALGTFQLYATRAGQVVIVQRSRGEPPLVFTPDDVAETARAIDEARRRRAAG